MEKLQLDYNIILYRGKTADFDDTQVWESNVLLYDTDLGTLKLGDGGTEYDELPVLNAGDGLPADLSAYLKTSDLGSELGTLGAVLESDFVTDDSEPNTPVLPEYLEAAISAAGFINDNSDFVKDDGQGGTMPTLPPGMEAVLAALFEGMNFGQGNIFLDLETDANTTDPYRRGTFIYVLDDHTLRIADGTTLFDELPVFTGAVPGPE